MKCANCDNKADYTTADPGVNPVDYCASCLPSWLRQRASAGHFPLVEPVDASEVSEPVVEEPQIVETVTEPEVVEPAADPEVVVETTTVKKTTKSKA